MSPRSLLSKFELFLRRKILTLYNYESCQLIYNIIIDRI